MPTVRQRFEALTVENVQETLADGKLPLEEAELCKEVLTEKLVAEGKKESKSKEKSLEGLGGWLILIGLVLVIYPLRMIVQTFPVYSEMFSDGSWESLTTLGTEAYNSFWAPLLLGEISINVVFVFLWIFIAFLFFTKKKIFPKWYIGITIFTTLFLLVDALAIKVVLPDEPVFDADTAKEFGRQVIQTFIWVPYMIVSKRVKETFVK